MSTSFLGIETLSRGLFAHQLTQHSLAHNLSRTYRDGDGYVRFSRERVDLTSAAPYLFSNLSGTHAVGTGPLVQQVTRLRSLFLDFQIQRESQTLGRAEVLAQTLARVEGILDNPAGTLEGALADLAASFSALGADPLNVGLRNDVTAKGQVFASTARDQFMALEFLQKDLNGEIARTVQEINLLLEQLHTVNAQLLGSPSARTNALLDERDYALARLSRLLNVSADFGPKGTATVVLGGITLVNNTGFARFDTSLLNDHNKPLSDIRLTTINHHVLEVTGMIRGGRLAGQLEARDVVLESFKSRVDQLVHSTLDVVNALHRAGYAADGATTNVSFFTGVSARDINVNASIVADPNRDLIAASSRFGVTTNGEIATFLGDLENLLADDFVRSTPPINNFVGRVDPTQPMNSMVSTALNGGGSNSTNFNFAPLPAGTFSVNSVNVSYANSDTLYDVVDAINAADPNVRAVFNYTEQRVYIFSNNTTVVNDVVPNSRTFLNLRNHLTSTIRMNNGFAPTDLPLDSTLPFNDPLNRQAYRVTPAERFTFTVNGISFSFTENQTLNAVLGAINSPAVGAIFNVQRQEVVLTSIQPIEVIDQVGNFTAFTGLNGSQPLGALASALRTDARVQHDGAEALRAQSAASLEQLNNAQAEVAALSFSASEAGTPFEVEQANAVKSLIAFNAALQALRLLDEMLSDLVSIVGSSSTSVIQARE